LHEELNVDGVAKSPPSGVAAVFQDLGILYVRFHPRKTTTPCGTKFLLSHPMTFGETSNVELIAFGEATKIRIEQEKFLQSVFQILSGFLYIEMINFMNRDPFIERFL